MGTIEAALSDLGTELVKKDIIKAVGIHEDEHDPHPFTVDHEHTAYAKDTNGGILNEDILEMFMCGHPDCNLPYRKHKARRTLMLQLKRDITKDDANAELIKIKPVLTKHKISRLGFVDTEKGYKFL